MKKKSTKPKVGLPPKPPSGKGDPHPKSALEKRVADLQSDNKHYRAENNRLRGAIETLQRRLMGVSLGRNPLIYDVLGQEMQSEPEINLQKKAREIADKILTNRSEVLTDEETNFIVGGRIDQLIIERLATAAEQLERNAHGFFHTVYEQKTVAGDVQRGMDLAEGHNDIFRARCMRAVVEWMSRNGRMFIRRM